MVARAFGLRVLLLTVGTLIPASALPRDAASQEASLTGTVVDSITGEPIPAAMVILTLPGRSSLSTMSNDSGTFAFRVNSYIGARLNITALGMAEWLHPNLPSSDALDLGRILLQATPYALPGLDVFGHTTCEAPLDSLERAFHAMEFARPRLRQISANDERNDQQYIVRIARSLRSWRGDIWDWRPDTVIARVPFAVPPLNLESIKNEGFAGVVSDTVHEYRAPTAGWFSNERLQDDYCLATSYRANDHGTETYGIDFWPKALADRVDVAGTIWLDSSGTPEEITFEYRSLQPFVQKHQLQWLRRYWELRWPQFRVVPRLRGLDERRHGGRLAFSEVSPGLWMTVEWEIRGVRLGPGGWVEDDVHYVVPSIDPLTTSGQLIAIVPRTSKRN
jgi:carboxypeptidase family protein